jgi:LAO/AO transport system kinase
VTGSPAPRRPGPAELVERLRSGDRRAVARLISQVENGTREQLREVAEALNPLSGRATVLGLTGSPGVGKSTLANALVAEYRKAGRTVGVLAVDPSSPFTGGALLGDRVRMQHHAPDQGVYIRSMATRGHLGGLARATPQAVRVLDAAGCEVVLVEIVGVGQAEVEVAGLADTTLVVVAPGFGDAVQAAKAGILEVADVFVVNKADKEDAEVVARDLRQMLHLGGGSGGRKSEASTQVPGGRLEPRGSPPANQASGGRKSEAPTPAAGDHLEPSGSPPVDQARPWSVPVVKTVAERGDGMAELVERIAEHAAHLATGGGLAERRRRRAGREVEEIALAELRAELGELGGGEALDKLAELVGTGELGPYAAADQLLERVRRSGAGRA